MGLYFRRSVRHTYRPFRPSSLIMKVWNRLLRSPGLRSAYRKLFPARVECRAATEADAPAVARLMELLFPPSARREALPSAERLLSETARAGGEYRVAVERHTLLGGVQVGPLLRSAGFEGCWVLGLWVHPHARGRGIGEALIRDVVRAAGERGEAALYCHIATTNAASTNLFMKLGFVPAPPDLQEKIEEKFGSAFGEGCGVQAYVYNLNLD